MSTKKDAIDESLKMSLGGTPYPDVKTRDIPMRVSRGLRLPQVLTTFQFGK